MSNATMRHIGETSDGFCTLCDCPFDESRWDNTNPANVTWDPDWASEVTCIDCLRIAIKIGEDAKRRLGEIEGAK